ncbi:hypothetical protein ONS96_004142 [Cadophora gregata f. sp. sojae]|nr:hypothetical protein ONS96_004142 [Cadophora gregata f. sp. sojae]
METLERVIGNQIWNMAIRFCWTTITTGIHGRFQMRQAPLFSSNAKGTSQIMDFGLRVEVELVQQQPRQLTLPKLMYAKLGGEKRVKTLKENGKFAGAIKTPGSWNLSDVSNCKGFSEVIDRSTTISMIRIAEELSDPDHNW